MFLKSLLFLWWMVPAAQLSCLSLNCCNLLPALHCLFGLQLDMNPRSAIIYNTCLLSVSSQWPPSIPLRVRPRKVGSTEFFNHWCSRNTQTLKSLGILLNSSVIVVLMIAYSAWRRHQRQMKANNYQLDSWSLSPKKYPLTGKIHFTH